MTKGLVISLYGLTGILILLVGCTQKIIPNQEVVMNTTAVTTVMAAPLRDVGSTTLEPTLPVPTLTAPVEYITGDCNKIAFSQYDGQSYDIYSVCPDGSRLMNLTNDPSDDVDPVWSPDGTQLAFSSTRSGHFQIYLMYADGTGVSALTADFENLKPIWLPDGRHIAFRTDDGKGLYWWRIINLDNSELVTLSEPSYDFFYQTPAWSPDGTRIAYMSLVEQQERNDGASQIHVKNTDGTNDVALTNDTWANFNPKWSPDGKKIAFLSERGALDKFALYLMNADGTEVQQLTDVGYPADVVYSWSPDGNQIAIGGNNLFNGINIIDIKSKTSRPLMEWSNPANVISPSWQP